MVQIKYIQIIFFTTELQMGINKVSWNRIESWSWSWMPFCMDYLCFDSQPGNFEQRIANFFIHSLEAGAKM